MRPQSQTSRLHLISLSSAFHAKITGFHHSEGVREEAREENIKKSPVVPFIFYFPLDKDLSGITFVEMGRKKY